jgi:hypothetical protein
VAPRAGSWALQRFTADPGIRTAGADPQNEREIAHMARDKRRR